LQHGEVNKSLQEANSQLSTVSCEKVELENKVKEFESEKIAHAEVQQSASALEENYKSQINELEDEKNNKLAEIAEYKINIDSLQKSVNEMKETISHIENDKLRLEAEKNECMKETIEMYENKLKTLTERNEELDAEIKKKDDEFKVREIILIYSHVLAI
jgi:chromosome segregation ATPase